MGLHALRQRDRSLLEMTILLRSSLLLVLTALLHSPVLAALRTPSEVTIPPRVVYCSDSQSVRYDVISDPTLYSGIVNALEAQIAAAARLNKLRATGLPFMKVRAAAAASGDDGDGTKKPLMIVLTVCSAVPGNAGDNTGPFGVKRLTLDAMRVLTVSCSTDDQSVGDCRRQIADSAGLPAAGSDELSQKYDWIYVEALGGGEDAAVALRSFTDTAARSVDAKRVVDPHARILVALPR
jgi:hypothetical protein